jgi:hypothetical protein
MKVWLTYVFCGSLPTLLVNKIEIADSAAMPLH